MKHKILEIFIVLSFAKYLDGQERKVVIVSDPEAPPENTEVEIKCVWTHDPWFVYLTVGAAATVSYDVKTNSVTIGNQNDKWRKRNEYRVVKDQVARTLSLYFKVKASEPNDFVCVTAKGPELRNAALKLNVTFPPNVTSVEVISASKNKSRFYAGEMVTIKCTIAVGNPPVLDKDVSFTAPDSGSKEWQTTDVIGAGIKKTKTLQFKKLLKAEYNGARVSCGARNTAGSSEVKKQYLNVLFGTQGLDLSVSNNKNISAGDTVTCSARGNPAPRVVISVYQYPEKERSWASKGATGYSLAELKIPRNATFTRYYFSCNASNALDSKFIAMVPVNVIATSAIPKSQNQAPMKLSAIYIGGAILGVLLLVVIGAVIYFLVQRRKKSQTKTPSTDYQPVSTKPTDQQGAPELEKDTGPYDIDDTYKSGSQHEPYGGSKDGRQSGLYYSDSIGGVNGQQHFPESGDQSVEHNLNYASLDFDETPRSRVPIVFKDSDKVDYAEIVSSHPFNYDDEHFYENVRHHNV